MEHLIVRGRRGPEVAQLRRWLARALGEAAAAYGLSPGSRRSEFDADAEAALRLWQSGIGMVGDGVAGPCTLARLDGQPDQIVLPRTRVRPLFAGTKPANIERYLPYVNAALVALEVTQPVPLAVALALIRAEAEGFVPVAEPPSGLNTLPGAGPFSAYDGRTEMGQRLGNHADEGERFRGRGFVQLSGRQAYERQGLDLGIDLAGQPELAASPEVAALVLANCVQEAAPELRRLLGEKPQQALRADEAVLREVRSALATGCPDEDAAAGRFVQAWRQIAPVWLGSGPVRRGATMTEARRRRDAGAPAAAEPASPASPAGRQGLSVRPDPADLRDRLYQPPPVSLPPVWPAPGPIRELLPRYSAAGLILDQGEDGACTGFGLACVINHLRWQAAGFPQELPSVSARMLYAYARRHDEYAGEDYEGSSCRGALKGWHRHGVCLGSDWGNGLDDTPKYGYAGRASRHTLGVYYRVDPQVIADVQAAIHQVGAVYVSAWVHEGWNALPERGVDPTPDDHADLPLIPFDGQPSREGGHAFALVGYNARGFVVQNSWGSGWGAGGFAVLGYADWLANAMDAWVVALGVPGVVGGRMLAAAVSPAPAAAGSATGAADWWSEQRAYDHSVLLGNDGKVRRYLTEDEPGRTLLHQVAGRADAWFRRRDEDGAASRRLVLYVHGGLNSEADGIGRARALGREFMANDCYPLFLVWKTGVLESLGHIVQDALATRLPAGAAAFGEAFSERTDRLVEQSLGQTLARPVWSEIKENAARAFAPGRGGELLVRALRALHDTWGERLEIHLIGHSAGAIALGHLASALAAQPLAGGGTLLDAVRSAHLYAPACTVAFANRHYAAHPALMERLHVHLLCDERERADQVARIYRKSLLYLVSNALESDARTPLLGMQRAWLEDGGWDGSSSTAATLRQWRDAARRAGLEQRLTVLAAARVCCAPQRELPASHGCFDNDTATLNHTLGRILGGEPLRPVRDLRGF